MKAHLGLDNFWSMSLAGEIAFALIDPVYNTVSWK
jgi:hypothetical protein